jgi:hypothetical protein
VAELRLLQSQMNHTVDQLCELVGRPEAAALLQGGLPKSGALERVFTPRFLELPHQAPFVHEPSDGQALCADTRFYSNHRQSLVQVVQQAMPRHAFSRYGLIINYAEFDGDLLSLVIDARELLTVQSAGKATLELVIETSCGQHCAFFAKVAWRVADAWSERQLSVRSNQVSTSSIEIERFDPDLVGALDIHLMFNPDARGSIEVRRMALTLRVQPMPAVVAVPENVFE